MNDNEEQQEQSMEVLQPSAIHILERAQIDTQVATAHQYPRSLETFKRRSMSMACLDQESAEQCIYVRPVGKKMDKATGKWVEEYAEGPSIRLAEIVAACYGNIRVAARIIEQTERFVRCEGVAHDLESNYAAKSEVIASTVKKDGTPFSEGMRAVVAKATLSKAFRDSTFKVVPRALCKPAYEAAKRVATGTGKPMESRRAAAKMWTESLRTSDKRPLSPARVLAALNVTEWSQVNDDQLLILTGLKTAIQDNDETVDSAFPPVEGDRQSEKAPVIPGAPKTPQVEPVTGTPATMPPTSQTPSAGQAAAGTVANPAEPRKRNRPTMVEPEEPAQTTVANAVQPETVIVPAEVPADTEKELGEAGLAPVSNPETVTPPAAPAADRAPFVPNPAESDAMQSLHLVAWKNDLSDEDLLAFCLEKKLRKPEQKLSDLAESKVLNVTNAIPTQVVAWKKTFRG